MNGNPLTDIRSLTKPDLEHHFLQQGEKKFRANQVYEWLWKKNSHSFDEMTNVPSALRQMLGDQFSFHRAVPVMQQRSADGTVKTAFRLHDDLLIEGVRIPTGNRATLCISSQVGCALGCRFCATGQNGFVRNLTVGEIFDQIAGMRDREGMTQGEGPEYKTRDEVSGISNIVFMGMGEPFLNYENVSGAIEKIISRDGSGMSPQRITVSSVGIPRMIKRMADDGSKYHFALSLHAASDVKRSQIIPFNLKHPLGDLSESLQYYHQKSGKRFTIEYILFGNFNDSAEDARDLATFCRSFPVKINIIEYNPVKGTTFSPPAAGRTTAFVEFLKSRNMVVNIRQSRGKDIDAACGQLAGRQRTLNNDR